MNEDFFSIDKLKNKKSPNIIFGSDEFKENNL